MKLKAILVEDEQISREILKKYVAKYCPNVNVIGEASNIEDALILIRNNELDYRFDVDGSSFNVAIFENPENYLEVSQEF